MTQIIITARGPFGSGKTTALLNITAELAAAGLILGGYEGAALDEERRCTVVATESSDGIYEETARFHVKQTEPSFRRKIFGEIEKERAYQTEKWGVDVDDTLNTPWMWVSYITQYSTNWLTGIFTTPTASVDLFRTAMIKTAAIAIAAVESLDRQRLANGRAFYEDADQEKP